MKVLVLAALLACASAAPQRLVVPRLPLNVLLRGNIHLVDPAIVGGTEATPGEFPFQISMQSEGFFGLSHFCGGSIYKENWVVSASHCVDGERPSDIIVVAGEHDRNVDEGTEQSRQVTQIIMHEGYNSRTVENDISLLKVDTPFTLNDRVGTINLPAQGELTPAGTVTTVTGWGTTSSGGSLPAKLRKVDVPIVSDAECRVNYGQGDIYDSMICAGLTQGGVDSCQGDSGGPLFAGNTLVGIVSWGYGCAEPGYPGVYTEVAYFVDWVNQKIAAASA